MRMKARNGNRDGTWHERKEIGQDEGCKCRTYKHEEKARVEGRKMTWKEEVKGRKEERGRSRYKRATLRMKKMRVKTER